MRACLCTWVRVVPAWVSVCMCVCMCVHVCVRVQVEMERLQQENERLKTDSQGSSGPSQAAIVSPLNNQSQHTLGLTESTSLGEDVCVRMCVGVCMPKGKCVCVTVCVCKCVYQCVCIHTPGPPSQTCCWRTMGRAPPGRRGDTSRWWSVWTRMPRGERYTDHTAALPLSDFL